MYRLRTLYIGGSVASRTLDGYRLTSVRAYYGPNR